MSKELSSSVLTAFEYAVKEVFKTMVHLDIDVSADEFNFSQDTDVVASHILLKSEGMVGICQVALERSLALKICKNMTGMEFDLNDPIVDDTVGELINMFLGFAKSQLARTENHFEIVPPFIITGKGLKVDGKLGTRTHKQTFLCDGEKFLLHIIYA